MGRDNHPRERQAREIERKQNLRASYERILIVCEGSKTEPHYFQEIRSKYRLHTANVGIYHSEFGTEPIQVVQYARHLFINGDVEKGIKARAFEKVFAVFDRDEHKTYFNALGLAAELDKTLRNDARQVVDFEAVASIPNFELWLLLHYENVQHPLHRDEVIVRLKSHIPNYDKGKKGVFELSESYLEVAKDRSSTLAELSNPHIDTEPYTDIFKLVKLLQDLKGS